MKTDPPDAAPTAPVFDIDVVKKQARYHLDNGPVTESYRGQRETVLTLLNQCLATELDCMLRYRQHHFLAATIGGVSGFVVRDELLVHSQEELGHADRLAARITQLGGHPRFSPEANTGAVSAVIGTLRGMLTEDLVAERVAIDTYAHAVRWIGDKDPTTRRLLEDILADEEGHADELADFLGGTKLADL